MRGDEIEKLARIQTMWMPCRHGKVYICKLLSALESLWECLSEEGTCTIFWVMDTLLGTMV